MKAAELSPGDKVFYLGNIEAQVIHVASNGILITYYGFGHQRDQLKRERVTIKQLTPRPGFWSF